MMDQGVDKRAGRAARRGVDDHAGGLVDDDQVIIFPNHLKGDVLTANMAFVGGLHGDLNSIALGHTGLGVGHDSAVDLHSAFGQKAHEAGPA